MNTPGGREKPRLPVGFLWRYSLQSFALIFLVALLIRTFLFSSYVMSGTSMLPSVWPGDFLLASKIRAHGLTRGAVVAMRCPLIKDSLCLRRVVGLPGDHIEFRKQALIVNGVAARYLPAGAFATEMIGGQSWSIWPVREGPFPTRAVVVPPQSLYLLNDKRADFDDSRQWGAVTTDFVEARILGVWMSLDWYESERVRPWPQVRWSRLFLAID